MRDIQILQDTLTNHCPTIHKKRLQSLLLATESALGGADLTLTKLGRSLNTMTTAKHAIKRVDRLLGNAQLHREKDEIYKWNARLIAGANPFPVILIDWSDVREQFRHMTLRASVALDGRAVTLYEQAFEYAQYNSPITHQYFLDKVQELLPKETTPIIVSDAGFRNTWFRQVQSKGWFWLGRVRGEVSIKFGLRNWQWNKKLHHKATNKPQSLGRCQLARRSPLNCNAYLVKQTPKGRKAQRHSRTCQKHTASRLFAKGANEPWLLVTNIPSETLNAVQITRLYAKRMQIEEAFRDLKSTAYGLALRHNRTRCTKRLNILLLIGLLTEILMWWNGLVATQAKWQYDFQANTIKHRRVLSIPRLGREVRKRQRYVITEQQYQWAMLEYQRLAHYSGLGKL
ncbi:IS4 family transposase [Enterovibrio sp. ZSDZ35]|uniref:IS4 family transposase n=1 Tax=Enterovibrio qingdaonensis TaxID=2899818 RepID=A0ABT5QU00_9GAMM|nr:IS4 family transposase [Enterovibrio sp. ZSDZ35]MDD1784450.1 IS4 family transposase [Enterovibrio sp. ZSDZ35]